MSRPTTYTKPQLNKLLDSLDKLMLQIDKKTRFTLEYGDVYFPKNSRKRAKELYKIRLAIVLLRSTQFDRIR